MSDSEEDYLGSTDENASELNDAVDDVFPTDENSDDQEDEDKLVGEEVEGEEVEEEEEEQVGHFPLGLKRANKRVT